ncbi:MAG: right-handed parallel beta-helix repeat-containing protein [Proteobacteria bacterium]|nr:right-handed parallel beta-helix repeat-containing protein [Pseudomonadota bacterium]
MPINFIIVSILSFLLLPSVLQAATFSVGTVSQLENALATAENNGEDDIINISAGTYNLSAPLSYGASNSSEDKDISLQGVGGEVVLDGGGINQRILFMGTSGHNSDITIRDITLTNGYAPEYSNGAGLFINIAGSNLTLENCHITDCFAGAFYGTNHGGGAYITAGLGSNVSIRNCVIAGNSAKGQGGGLYLGLIDGTLTFANNTVVDNHNKTSVVEGGGGIYLRLFFDNVTAHLYNNILWGNSYAHGDGDLYIDDAEYDPEKAATVIMANNDYRQLDWNLGTNLTLSDNISLDPLLSADFYLSPSSPCLDAGSPDAPWLSTQDIEGDPRSVDGDCNGISLPDMGADEYYRSPTVSTTAVTDITSTTATSGGNICNGGYQAVTTRGICWSTFPVPTLADSCTDNGSGSGAFVSSLTGLTMDTRYYVRAYATNSAGTSFGEEQRFTPTSYPTLITSPITDIDAPTATGGGNVIGEGDTAVTLRGVCWDTSPNPTLEDNCTNDGTGTGIYPSALAGLLNRTTYYVRAYASNSAGTTYGTQTSFYAKKRFSWPMFVPRPKR